MAAQQGTVTTQNRIADLSADLGTTGQYKSQSHWHRGFRTLRRDKLTLAAIAFLLLLGLLAILAPLLISTLAGVGPDDTNLDNTFAKPYLIPYIQWRLGSDMLTAPQMLGKSGGVTHWVGTDKLGRDQLARLLYGARVSLGVALAATSIALLLGTFVGSIAGYFGGRMDDLIIWLINTMEAIPTIYLLIIVSAIFRPSPSTLILFLGLVGWLGTARFMRGSVIKIRELDYTLAARSVGSPNWRILLQHILPNAIPVIIVVTTIQVGSLILVEATLSFLGLGIQPPTATWGGMLRRAQFLFFQRDAILHLMWPPGLLIMFSVLCFYLIGDGLRDAFDPTLEGKA